MSPQWIEIVFVVSAYVAGRIEQLIHDAKDHKK
jgi:hypothetical protein